MGRLVLAGLLANRLRSASTVVAAQLAVALVCVLTALPAELRSFLAELTSEARSAIVHRGGLSYGLPLEVARRARELPSVLVAAASTWFGGSADPTGRVTFPSVAVEAARVAQLYPDYRIAPEELGAFLRHRDAALVGEQTLRREGWRVGDRITLASALWGVDLELEVVGALPGQPGVWLQDAYLDEALRARGGQGIPWNTLVWTRLAEPPGGWAGQGALEGDGAVQGRAGELAAAVDALGRELGVPLTVESERAFYARLLADLSGLARLLELVAALVAVCTAVVAASSLSLGVRDRARELATLRALGWSRGRVAGLVLGEGACVGVAGGVGGVLGALALVALARARVVPASGELGDLFGMLAGARIGGGEAAVAAGAAVLVGAAAACLPAAAAVRRPSPLVLREAYA